MYELHDYFMEIYPQLNDTEYFRWQVNIGSGNDFVPLGSKSLPEPILNQIYVTIWHH